MKKLELMGVQELDTRELLNKNGGMCLIDIYILYYECCLIQGFCDGRGDSAVKK